MQAGWVLHTQQLSFVTQRATINYNKEGKLAREVSINLTSKMASHEQSYKAGEAQGRAEEKTGRVTDTMKEKAREAKDKTYEAAQQGKEKTSQKSQEAREKTAETAESAKQKAQESKEETKGVLQQTGDKVKQMAESAKDTVKHTLGMGGPGEDEGIYTGRDETEDPAGYKHATTHKETKC